jgi:hypothetical protein
MERSMGTRRSMRACERVGVRYVVGPKPVAVGQDLHYRGWIGGSVVHGQVSAVQAAEGYELDALFHGCSGDLLW